MTSNVSVNRGLSRENLVNKSSARLLCKASRLVVSSATISTEKASIDTHCRVHVSKKQNYSPTVQPGPAQPDTPTSPSGKIPHRAPHPHPSSTLLLPQQSHSCCVHSFPRSLLPQGLFLKNLVSLLGILARRQLRSRPGMPSARAQSSVSPDRRS